MFANTHIQIIPDPPTRIWCDGCYDLVHFGHANSLRQAKAYGDQLVVGVHTDEDITKHKGPPVFTFEERCKIVEGIRWVNEVVKGAPYVTTLETLRKYNCRYCCHGDDVALTETGEDTYQQIKASGKYREVERTAGISTTGLVERILAMEKEKEKQEETVRSPWTGSQKVLLTTGRIVEFSGDAQLERKDVVIYVVGGFDLFHVGHVQFLEKAKELGTYLIVGLYSDHLINQCKGSNYPVMTLHERLLSLLACKYVSEVLIDAPFSVTKELMEELNIDVVARGYCQSEDETVLGDPYEYPKEVDKFLTINSESDVTTEDIIERVVKNKSEYKERNERKEKKELDVISEMEKMREREQAR